MSSDAQGPYDINRSRRLLFQFWCSLRRDRVWDHSSICNSGLYGHTFAL